MTAPELPSIDCLRKMLRYNPDTGRLFWLERTPEMFCDGPRDAKTNCNVWNARYAGKEAFTSISASGYRFGSLFNRSHRAHRVAFAISTGAWPQNDMDHINGDRLDNRLSNLREATRSENLRNSWRPEANNSGVKGVSWCRKKKLWRATIKASGKQVGLGYFANIDDAKEAVHAARAKLHGAFAHHGDTALAAIQEAKP